MLSVLEDSESETASFDFSEQARAGMAQTNCGVLRIYATFDTEHLLGAEICTPAAEHLAHFMALAAERRLSVADMLANPFYRPVLEQGLRSALRDLAKAVSGAGGSDLSGCAAIGHDALD